MHNATHTTLTRPPGKSAAYSARTIRFWHLHRLGWVKLTIRPGQTVNVETFSRDDEGFTREADSFTVEGNHVRNEWGMNGRDCDGGISRGGLLVCHVSRLEARAPYKGQTFAEQDAKATALRDVPGVPDWEKVNSNWQSDEYAEAAGY